MCRILAWHSTWHGQMPDDQFTIRPYTASDEAAVIRLWREVFPDNPPWLRQIGCTKINLQIRISNQGVVSFYQKLGYAVEERVSMGKRLT
jgi:ribosomal protein S18 acetylase RimI-like enzyme